MMEESDKDDKTQARIIALVVTLLCILLLSITLIMIPAISGFIGSVFSPGLGLKYSAVISFFVTVILMIVFAVAAGDGLIGEIQFMLGSFFSFFIIIWLLIAWIF